MVLAFVNWLGFASWTALLNNFAKEAAGFSGQDIGILQSVREIPGFLAFTAIVLFWFMREQILAYLSLVALGVGVAITGFYPTLGGLLLTTTIMSLGFHYYETAQQSLQLQLLPKAQAPRLLGRDRRGLGAGAAAGLRLDRRDLAGVPAGLRQRLPDGGAADDRADAGRRALVFPRFQGVVPQNKGFVLRRRYWLYYALTFMSGARRQIFMAFGGFLLVERFGYDVSATATLLLIDLWHQHLHGAGAGRTRRPARRAGDDPDREHLADRGLHRLCAGQPWPFRRLGRRRGRARSSSWTGCSSR